MHNEREETISKYWEEKKIFEQSVESKPKEKQYVFYDGPPFATGLPHYGHILALTSKDLFPRYFTMRGFRCERKWGWDCHGLPIENIAEKKLGIKEKKEIEALGIDKFNETCREQVLHFASEWKKTVNRIGKWIEFDNAYKTMDNSYMESVWWIFKKLHTDGYLYEGKKILMYCPRCETPLSKSEIAMDNSYKDVTEKTATVKFKLKDEDAYILAWTTTPWTLIGNVALAVNEQLIYAKIKYGGQTLIMAKDRLHEVKGDYELLDEFPGEKLLKKEYEPLYPQPSEKKGHYIINGGQEVSAEEGTGIVHMAIYGEFDYEMIRKYDLPIIQHVGKTGRIEAPSIWEDTWFKDADKLVLADLEDRGLLFAAKDYTHPYPFCYRCDTPLFYNAVDSWFVDIQKIKPRLLEANKDINWYPSHLKEGRFHQNLEAAPDWAISRNRFWATSIPVWKCEDGHMEVLGSIEELREKAIENVDSDDLHKHIVDKYHLKCECGKEMTRIPEVIDCWFESGAMPYAAKHYPFENKDWMQVNFPADFISEYIAQVRAWFYYMHVLGVLLMDKAPFKHCVVSGTVLAADGQKMSKSKSNFPDPNDVIEKYGADALRFYLMNSSLMRAEDLNFQEEGVREIYRKVLTLLSNVKRFYGMFADENPVLDQPSTDHILDKWIVSRTHKLVRDCTNSFEEYNTITPCQDIMSFIDDLSTWYVRRSRDRFKADDAFTKDAAVKTLGYVLHTLSKVMAPITPFISEDIHLALKAHKTDLPDSVHLEDWPGFDLELIKEDVESKMTLTRDAVTRALDAREQAKMPIRQALAKLTLRGADLDESYLELIKDELNVKEVVLEAAEDLSVELDTNLTPELIREGQARELIRKLNNERKKEKLTVNDKIKLFIEIIDEETKKAFDEHQADICKSVQAQEVEFKVPDQHKEVKIGENLVRLAIEKL